MKMISYAQNCEDVRLSRAFANQTDGFYIDVGASLPVGHSVTKHFYELGWHGINIEPMPTVFALLEADRLRDINLNFGISNREGNLPFYEAPANIGRSTFVKSASEGWREFDGCEFIERSIPVSTLSEVCERYVDRRIDFLKIDVEGHELAVLEGFDLKRWRPRVILLEGSPDTWEHLLLEADYTFATCDGINQYYVRSDEQDLIAKLAAPPSILDNFVVHEHLVEVESYKAAIARLSAELEGSKGELSWASKRIEELQSVIERTQGAQPRLGREFKGTQDQSGETPNPGSNTARVVLKLRKLAKRVPGATQLVRKMRRSA